MKLKSTVQIVFVMLFASVMISCNSSTKTSANSSDSSVSSSSANADSYTSKMTKSDKKKYYDSNGNVVYEIKYKADGFKLRTSSSDLIWKIKLYDGKVKISDNEENLNPYEIKMVNTYDAKLVKNDETLARTSYNLEKKQQSMSSESDAQPEFSTGSYSPSLLVNKIQEIQTDQKQIIIKELKAKGY